MLLITGAPYTLISISILLAVVTSIFIAINIHWKTFKLFTRQYILVVIIALTTFGIAYFLTETYYVYASTDSFQIILQSKILFQYGVQPYALDKFTDWGVITTVFQMASSLMDLDYLSGYQTILFLLLVGLLITSMVVELRKSFKLIPSVMFGGLSILVLLSIMFIEHSVYLHTNITAAVYIFMCLLSIRYFLEESALEWLILGSVSLIGVGFSRIEGPLYAVLFAALAVSIKKFSVKQVLYLLLPFSILGLAWHAYLYFSNGQSGTMDEINIVIIIMITLIGLIGYSLLSTRFKKENY